MDSTNLSPNKQKPPFLLQSRNLFPLHRKGILPHRHRLRPARRRGARPALSPSPTMPLPRDPSNGSAATPKLTGYSRAPLDEPLLEKPPPRRSELLRRLGFWRGGEADGALDWSAVRSTCKEWIKNPMNIALLLWLLCVGISGGMFVLLLLGFLDGAFPAAADRNHWIEVNNQVLNALFTLMSLYQHPALCHHLFLLCRWRLPHDAAELRAAYCGGKDGGGPRRGERAHMAIVLVLLHLTVVCQYVLCGLYWCYPKPSRPELLEDGFFALGVAAPVAAVLYTVCSPLGRDQCGDLDEASVTTTQRSAPAHAVVVVEPEWAGGMFDCGGGAATWWLSLSCTFCVFGWNAERLGFGNAYVHVATFVLLCFAPLWVFGVSALHIHEVAICDVVGCAGVLLCACGLLYGGYWRIQMRKKFRLPGSAACCGSKSLTDYARWLFCWPCALAQEVRTASLYEIHGETFFHRNPAVVDNHVEPSPSPVPPPHHHPAGQAEHVVVVHDEMVPPAVVQVVVVRVKEEEEDETREELNAVHDEKKIESPPAPTLSVIEDGSSLLTTTTTSDLESVVHFEHRLSGGRWSVEKVKRLLNLVTMVSLLILLYSRGFIR